MFEERANLVVLVATPLGETAKLVLVAARFALNRADPLPQLDVDGSEADDVAGPVVDGAAPHDAPCAAGRRRCRSANPSGRSCRGQYGWRW